MLYFIQTSLQGFSTRKFFSLSVSPCKIRCHNILLLTCHYINKVLQLPACCVFCDLLVFTHLSQWFFAGYLLSSCQLTQSKKSFTIWDKSIFQMLPSVGFFKIVVCANVYSSMAYSRTNNYTSHICTFSKQFCIFVMFFVLEQLSGSFLF